MTAQLRIDWSALPMSTPDGQLLPHLSAKARTRMVDEVFHGAGGFDRLLAWVEKSDDTYGEFITKVWAKGTIKPVSNELSLGDGVEALLARLDAGDNARDISPSEESTT